MIFNASMMNKQQELSLNFVGSFHNTLKVTTSICKYCKHHNKVEPEILSMKTSYTCMHSITILFLRSWFVL